MKRHITGRAPDYTAAALVSAGVNLFCFLLFLRLTLGWAVVLFTALLLYHLIDRLARRRSS